MSSEIRSKLRQVKRQFATLKTREKAIESLKELILKTDRKGNYSASAEYLIQLADFQKELGNTKVINLLLKCALARASLSNNGALVNKINSKFDETHPYSRVAQEMSKAKENNKSKGLHLTVFKFQTIFGDYMDLQIPFIKFEDKDEVEIMLEDYYPSGKYMIQLIDAKSQFTFNLELPIGKLETIDVLESVNKSVI